MRTKEHRLGQLLLMREIRRKSVKPWPEIAGLKREKKSETAKTNTVGTDGVNKRTIKKGLAGKVRGAIEALSSKPSRAFMQGIKDLLWSLQLVVASVIVIAGSIALIIGSLAVVHYYIKGN